MMWVGCTSSGQSAIWSMLAPRFAAADTTRRRRLLATVASAVGSASAVAASMLAVDEWAIGPARPNTMGASVLSSWSRSRPKSSSPVAPAAPAAPAPAAVRAAIHIHLLSDLVFLVLDMRLLPVRVGVSDAGHTLTTGGAPASYSSV